mmetsp:Transcript_969/g.3913  ORF Transcript_969/g.3913 Transcript_969/m.3913 type:complete len:330 (-) Transcript_969:836-1825(-)
MHTREYQAHQRRVHRGRSHEVARAAVSVGSAPVLIRPVALARVAGVHVAEKREKAVKQRGNPVGPEERKRVARPGLPWVRQRAKVAHHRRVQPHRAERLVRVVGVHARKRRVQHRREVVRGGWHPAAGERLGGREEHGSEARGHHGERRGELVRRGRVLNRLLEPRHHLREHGGGTQVRELTGTAGRHHAELAVLAVHPRVDEPHHAPRERSFQLVGHGRRVDVALARATFPKVPHRVLDKESDVLVPPAVVAGMRVRLRHVHDGFHRVRVRALPVHHSLGRGTQPVHHSLGGGPDAHPVLVDKPVEQVRRPRRRSPTERARTLPSPHG